MPNINTKFTLQGEKEYRDAISRINSGIKVLNAEMKATTAAYQGNEKSVEALNAKNDILQRTLYSQKEKVEQLRAALEKSAQTYGEGDKRTMKWKESLYNAEAALHKTEAAIRDNNNALGKLTEAEEQADEKTKGLGDAVGILTDKLGIRLPAGANAAINKLGRISPAAMTAATGVAALTAAVVKAEKALIDTGISGGKYADNILTLSDQTGLATDTLQTFSYAAELMDVSVDTIQGSLTKLTNRMQDVQNGNDAVAGSFDKLGVMVQNTDSSLRSAEDVFYDAIDALQKVDNQTERDALAMDIFGKSAQDLNPLIKKGTDVLKDYAKQAQDTGYVLDKQTLEKLGAVDDAMQKLDKRKEAVKNSVASEFAPALTESIGQIEEAIGKAGEAVVKSGAVEAFGSILTSATGLIEPLTTLGSSTLPLVSTGLKGVAYLTATIADAASAVTSLLTLDFKGFSTAMGWRISKGDLNAKQKIENAAALQTQVYDPSTGMWTSKYALGQNAAGTNYWRGGTTWVGENGPELVSLPRGTAITSASESRSIGGDTFYVTIDARNVDDFNRVVKLAKEAAYRGRMR